MWAAYPLFFLAMMLIAMRTGAFGAMLTALVPAWRRGALMSLTVAMGQVGYSLGGAAAGPLYARLGFAADALLGAAVALGAGLVIWFRLPEPEPTGE
jgi:predicted MFS family arabinose efflux permease